MLYRWRRGVGGLAVAAALAVPLMCSAGTAQADPLVCNYSSFNWTWQSGHWNTSPDQIKGTDGCATPWVVLYTTGSTMEGWVYYSGAYHSGGKPYCSYDTSCGLWTNWSYNGDKFHVQEPDENTYDQGVVNY